MVWSQEGVEVPLNTSFLDIPSGTYKKDLNNVLDPYIGVWKGTLNSRRFTLYIDKYERKLFPQSNGDYYYCDILIGRYEYINLNTGEVYQDNSYNWNFDEAKITSLSKPKNNLFTFRFRDSDYCLNTATITLVGDPTIGQIGYRYNYVGDWNMVNNCPYTHPSQMPIPIPEFSMNLIRQ